MVGRWSCNDVKCSNNDLLYCYCVFITMQSLCKCSLLMVLQSSCNVIGHKCNNADVVDLLLFIVFVHVPIMQE